MNLKDGHRWLLASVATLALLTLVPMAPVAAGGNSASVKACQNGGWMTLHRPDGSGFANQGACVSHGARGGTYQQARIISVTSYDYQDPLWQRVAVSGDGFAPDHLITFTVTGGSVIDNALNLAPGVRSDPTGAFSSGSAPAKTTTYLELSCDAQTIHVTATDGVNTAEADATLEPCQQST